jgi:eukaryotic-like serine/threonine-protein kinase
MGEVFLAREDTAGTVRAVVVKKVLENLAQNRHFVGRFLDEAKVVVHLNHPNIARVFAMGEVDREYFLAMEYVQGKTVSRLARRLREARKAFPLGLALLLGERICEGLAYAHAARDESGAPLRLVHRDLSPANVCVSYRGEVKIIDFGAAESTLKEEKTAPGVVIGNLAYMAPEQARKETVGPTADVYSVGVMMWELATAKALAQKGDPSERWRRAANPAWEAPSQLRKSLPRELDDVLMRALRPEARHRYPTAAALGEALGALRQKVDRFVSDEALGALLSSVYQREKAAEETLLRVLLHGLPSANLDSERTLLVPPTALAFEHRGARLGADESTESKVGPPSFRADVVDPGGGRVGFGVSLEAPTGELSLEREIEGFESATVAVDPRPGFANGVAVLLGVLLAAAVFLWWLL